jgi:hypothetical protein
LDGAAPSVRVPPTPLAPLGLSEGLPIFMLNSLLPVQTGW